MYRALYNVYILAPLMRKSTYTNLSNLNLLFGAPVHFGAPMQQKHVYNLTFWCTCPIPPMCVRRLAPVSLAAAPSHHLPKGTISMGAAGCRPAVGAKIIEIGVNAIQKWVQFTPKCSQKRWWLGLRPRPQ